MSRLSKEQWLDHGLKALTGAGYGALKADTLSKSLGVSRGSFYWHFKNLADFHAEILARWQAVTVDAAIQQIDATAPAKQQLATLIELASRGGQELDDAIRAWALHNTAVNAAVQQVDALRLSYLDQLLQAGGLAPQQAQARARIIYWSSLGRGVTAETLSDEMRALIVDELILMSWS